MATKKSKAPKSVEGIFQKFMEFLNSPVWSLPIVSFIEQRSIVFDKEQGDSKIYRQIHGEFRSMVDMLMECFCDDIGIKPEQLTQAIKSDKAKATTQLDQSILEPVMAAQDFDLFVHMMTRKNIELQLQALQMIEFMCGLIPAVLMPLKTDDPGATRGPAGKDGPPSEEQERIILIQVMKQSKDEYEKEQHERTSAQKELEEAMKASLTEKTRLQEAHREQEQLVNEAMQLTLSDKEKTPETKTEETNKRPASAKPKKSVEKKPDDTEVEAAAKSGKTAADIRAMLKDKESVSENEIRARQEYLRKQRDKLLSMKREARELAFAEQESETKRRRPKTAQAVRSALRGKPMGQPKISNEVLEARKALAQKLKEEVMKN